MHYTEGQFSQKFVNIVLALATILL